MYYFIFMASKFKKFFFFLIMNINYQLWQMKACSIRASTKFAGNIKKCLAFDVCFLSETFKFFLK